MDNRYLYPPEIKDIQLEIEEICDKKKYDKDVVIISNNNAGNYCDYYFYSPKLNKNCIKMSN